MSLGECFCSILCLGLPLLNLSLSRGLSIVDLTDQSSKVDEGSGEIEDVGKLRGSIVLWEGVMKVVPTLAQSKYRRRRVLSGRNVGIVGSRSDQMSERVDAPSRVKQKSVSAHRDKVGRQQPLAPQKVGYDRGQEDAEEKSE